MGERKSRRRPNPVTSLQSVSSDTHTSLSSNSAKTPKKRKLNKRPFTLGMLEEESVNNRNQGKRYLSGIIFWCWPLILLAAIYITCSLFPQIIHKQSFIENTQNNGTVSGHNIRSASRETLKQYHFTICQEETIEAKETALIKSVVKIHGSWSQGKIENLLEELLARYNKRSDFYNFESPTDISIGIVDHFNEKEKKQSHFIAQLYYHTGKPVKIQWNPALFPNQVLKRDKYSSTFTEYLSSSLSLFPSAEPEIKILPGYDNARAFQISVIDYNFNGDIDSYISMIAYKSRKFLSRATQPCEGIFIALFNGNYYISSERCLSLPEIQPEIKREPLLANLDWKQSG